VRRARRIANVSWMLCGVGPDHQECPWGAGSRLPLCLSITTAMTLLRAGELVLIPVLLVPGAPSPPGSGESIPEIGEELRDIAEIDATGDPAPRHTDKCENRPKRLRNQQVAGSSPAPGSTKITQFHLTPRVPRWR
jgi:hypothetical protein